MYAFIASNMFVIISSLNCFWQLYLESHKRSHRNAVTTAASRRKGVSTRSKSLVWWKAQCKNTAEQRLFIRVYFFFSQFASFSVFCLLYFREEPYHQAVKREQHHSPACNCNWTIQLFFLLLICLCISLLRNPPHCCYFFISSFSFFTLDFSPHSLHSVSSSPRCSSLCSQSDCDNGRTSRKQWRSKSQHSFGKIMDERSKHREEMKETNKRNNGRR